MRPLRILVVDDSVVVRHVMSDVLPRDPEFEVTVAASGRLALRRLEQQMPDLVLLDIEMPEMNGLATLAAIRERNYQIPVVMFSVLTATGAAATIEALARGATDYFTKPSHLGSAEEARRAIVDELVPKIRALCGRVTGSPEAKPAAAYVPSGSPMPRDPITAVGIGASTGGPNALEMVLAELPPDFPIPVFIVQHMPREFTTRLASRLDETGTLPVREVVVGGRVTPGLARLAPGDHHMVVARQGRVVDLRLHRGPKILSCRPAVDVLFESMAEAYGAGTLAVVLTGMGQDGLAGCRAIREAGGHVVVQDRDSSVVWGMPGNVADAGLAHGVLPLDQIGPTIVRLVTGGACN